MGLRLVVCFGLGAMAIPATAFAQANAGDAVRNWTAITECRAISDAQRRLGCMDDVLRRAGIAAAPPAAPQVSPPQAARAEPLAPPQTPARPQAEARPQAQARAQVRAETKELTSTIAAVQTVGFQRVRITAADGSVWEQSEAETFNTSPKVGDAFSVEPGSFGSTRCRFNQSSRYQCRQVN